MAERPIFVPMTDGLQLVKEIFIPLQWHSGFAATQKQKNIAELHTSARAAGFFPLLEVSTKSEKISGRHLSAFHLKVRSLTVGILPLECAFQGSKVFEFGGPYFDLYKKSVKDAKRDPRLKQSGKLIRFDFDGQCFPLEPKTFFYDWLYINAIYEHREWLAKLNSYVGFTDVEFNPRKSINCQARSIALFLALMMRNLLDEVVRGPENFRSILAQFDYRPALKDSSDYHREIDWRGADNQPGPEQEIPERNRAPATRPVL